MIAYSRTAFLIAGAIVSVAAIFWWWGTYYQVVGFGYLSWPEAGKCLIGDSTICTLAKALCLGSHPREFVSYASSVLWGGVALLSIGLVLAPSRTSLG
jgi:hypothetical protein